MARLPRLTLPGHLHHVIQRGNNRQPIFIVARDYQTMLELVKQHANTFGVAIHAYVLMENHFHLLATPDTADGLPKMMQAIGRRYVRYFNDVHGRSGTLWEGRYRSTLLDESTYLLPCMVYLDLNPVRADYCTSAGDYVWSSYAHYCGTRVDPLVSPHPLFWNIGNTPFAREAAYAQMVQQGIGSVQLANLTESVLQGWALGDEKFAESLQKQTPRRVSKLRPGRPTTRTKLV
jgi:putative transposase